MLPTFTLTLRALARGRRLLVVAALLVVPALLALAYRAAGPPSGGGGGGASGGGQAPSLATFVVLLFDQLVLPILLPLTALIFATTALGDEMEDRTLIYLTLRPVSRLGLVIAKLLAAAAITVVLVEISLALTYLIAVQGAAGARDLSAVLLAGLAGCLAYCSLFLLLGLVIPRRALVAGFIYVLVWEGAAAGISTALATLTVRRYVEGALHAGLSTLPATQVPPPGVDGTTSVAVLALIVLGGIGLTTWRLRRAELP